MSGVSGFIAQPLQKRWLVSAPPASVTPATWREEMWKVVHQHDFPGVAKISACRSGVIKFDFNNGEPAALVSRNTPVHDYFENAISATAARLKLMNAFAVCMHSAHLTEHEDAYFNIHLGPNDLIHFDERGNEGGSRILELPRLDRIETIPNFILDHPDPDILPTRVLEVACLSFASVLQKRNSGAIDLCALLNQAANARANHDFSLSLVLSWTVCESLLGNKWESYYTRQANLTGITLNRNKRKTYDRQYAVATVIEILGLSNELPLQLYERLSSVRSNRNSWLHQTRQIDRADAEAALDVTKDLLDEVLGISLSLGYPTNISGPL
jgi:hypothetical protein